jgi:hypothetical protein
MGVAHGLFYVQSSGTGRKGGTKRKLEEEPEEEEESVEGSGLAPRKRIKPSLREEHT